MEAGPLARTYNDVTQQTIQDLREIVGEKGVIADDSEQLKVYGFDVLGLLHGQVHPPDVVVKPDSSEQVSEIMKLASRETIPVTPRGAGSGLAGAAIPVRGGIVLSLERMNRILEINRIDRVAVVEPGVITNDLCTRVAEKGLMYAGYPMSTETSFIGGNVATNAGGGKVIRYGNTRRHVLGLEVVLPSGEVIEVGGKFRKSTWGYDLLNLMIGSEGTLGVFTKIILNLISAPKLSMDVLVPFPDTETAVNGVAEVIVSDGVIPETVEFMDRICFTESSRHHGISLPIRDSDRAGAFLIIQIQGETQEELEELCEQVGKKCLAQGAIDVFVAVSPRQSDDIWKIREQFGEAVAQAGPNAYFTSDIVVPFSKVPEMMRELERLEQKYGIRIPTVGHIADGNLHSALYKPDDVSVEAWPEKAEEIFDEMSEIAMELGGVGSGEHGVGLLKRPLFLKVKTETELAIMRGIKQIFDPDYILNPGKVI
jgi:glycolate oxidase